MDATFLLTVLAMVLVSIVALLARRWEPISEEEADEVPEWAREERE